MCILKVRCGDSLKEGSVSLNYKYCLLLFNIFKNPPLISVIVYPKIMSSLRIFRINLKKSEEPRKIYYCNIDLNIIYEQVFRCFLQCLLRIPVSLIFFVCIT